MESTTDEQDRPDQIRIRIPAGFESMRVRFRVRKIPPIFGYLQRLVTACETRLVVVNSPSAPHSPVAPPLGQTRGSKHSAPPARPPFVPTAPQQPVHLPTPSPGPQKRQPDDLEPEESLLDRIYHADAAQQIVMIAQHMLQDNPEDVNALACLSYALLRVSDAEPARKQARQAAETVVRLTERRPTLRLRSLAFATLAWIYELDNTGKIEPKTLDANYQKAIEVDPTYAIPYPAWADYYVKKGEWERARGILETALTRVQESPHDRDYIAARLDRVRQRLEAVAIPAGRR